MEQELLVHCKLFTEQFGSETSLQVDAPSTEKKGKAAAVPKVSNV
jgi:hypothetical protein